VIRAITFTAASFKGNAWRPRRTSAYGPSLHTFCPNPLAKKAVAVTHCFESSGGPADPAVIIFSHGLGLGVGRYL